jgi:RNA polymerase sigma factor (sigma-70 family)
MATPDPKKTVAAVWRIESARIIASLARMVKDVGLAEDFAQQALIAALETWPHSGVPDNPGAWLTATAKRRALDHLRRGSMLARKHGELERDTTEQESTATALDARMDDDVRDDLLRLIFTACHPVLAPEARVALTLRMVGGLTTEEIARAFLTTTVTMQQRIVRAKKTLADAAVPFELPHGSDRVARLSSVLEVIYLVFNEGYAATAGADWMRPALCEDALRIGRILQGLARDEAEVHGLLALMEIQASRAAARTTPDGAPILLLEQDRARWNQLLIRRGLDALAIGEALTTSRGPYLLQAAIAACHARATKAPDTDWARIAALYDELAALVPSPVVELNRAVAHGIAHGPEAGLLLVDALVQDGTLVLYHLLPSVRGDLLEKLGHAEEARAEFERAASLTKNVRERELLMARAARVISARG